MTLHFIHGVSFEDEEYQKMKAHMTLLELLAMSEEEANNNRVSPIMDTFNDLRTLLEEF